MPFVTADQLVAHAVGDYVLQSDWMANEKTKRSVAALAHAVTYSLPFLLLRPSVAAISFVLVTHFLIDRWRLARYVVWAKNFIAPRWIDRGTWSCDHCQESTKTNREGPCWTCGSGRVSLKHQVPLRNHPWSECSDTGYHDDRPAFLALWLMIICDNVLHVLCNALALRYM